ncbi:CHASE domain-containing protein [Sphingomonas sp. GCM10030256]|uniref:CHASE domain-containing protein n=1 Tax=Sphingomonas sp. GCM10030256 TaxID=3273427 RepID=UPI00360AEC66
MLVVGLLASLLAAWQLSRTEERRSLARFEGLAASVQTAIANKLDMQLALLRGTRGLFAASGEVNTPEFNAYVRNLDLGLNYPGILGIGFAQVGVRGRPVEGHHEAQGRMASSIRYLAPLSPRNRAAIGVDMLSEPTRRTAMLRALNTGQPALSGVVRLVQEIEPEKQPGFLLYVPVQGGPGEFRGWVYSPLRGHDLFGSLFAKPEFAGARIRVYLGSPAEASLLFTSSAGNEQPRHSSRQAIAVGGTTLTIDVASTAAFERSSPLALPLIVWVLGSLISVLFAGLVDQQQRSVERTTRQVALRTAELQAANTRLLEESEARSKAEAQLHQAQKMEVVGQLTGGLAHDFNNMLAVVIGSLDFARHTDDVSRLKQLIDQALKGATKAAELTQRLLAFSRRQTLMPDVVDVNVLVADMSELLRRTLGGTARLQTSLAADPWPVFADPAQVQSAILNLAVNARDAMPSGGTLSIETGNCELDEVYAGSHPGARAGPFVMIAVSDTGEGMSAEVQAKALEPFFTTKGVGRGTGLGLSQVFGFVKQSGGHLALYSEQGRGTTVRLYLPRHAGELSVEEPAAAADNTPLPRGRADELILAVEDEEDVRLMSVSALRDLGYTVVHAADGAAALRELQANPGIRLVFTDLVMPELDGAELAREVRARWPHMKLLFTTGYAPGAMLKSAGLGAGELITKPFTISDLARKVRAVLDGER